MRKNSKEREKRSKIKADKYSFHFFDSTTMPDNMIPPLSIGGIQTTSPQWIATNIEFNMKIKINLDIGY